MVRFYFSVLLAKLFLFIIKAFSLGSGSTWPGHIAVETSPHFLKQALKNKNLKIIVIAGTNGKTTTAKMLATILENENIKTFQNEEGANLLNGIATAVVKNTTILGRLKKNVAIFEIDEGNLPLFLKDLKPDMLILLNLFRDQLDRYGEVNIIAQKWFESIKKLTDTQVFLNADDPLINSLGKGLKNVTYFGLPHEEMKKSAVSHDADSLFCPNCGQTLTYSKVSFSHLGDYSCSNCKFKRNTPVFALTSLNYPLSGVYNHYNTQAASVVAFEAFEISIEGIREGLSHFKPAFGRQEKIEYKGRNINILLSKNPTGFNQSIQAVKELSNGKKNSVLLVLNDRIPDGRDVSWIWDTEADELLKISDKIIISGDRCYDMALRLKYSQSQNKSIIHENLKTAINYAIKATEKDETLFILPTYSAMLEVRKILTGKEML